MEIAPEELQKCKQFTFTSSCGSWEATNCKFNLFLKDEDFVGSLSTDA